MEKGLEGDVGEAGKGSGHRHEVGVRRRQSHVEEVEGGVGQTWMYLEDMYISDSTASVSPPG